MDRETLTRYYDTNRFPKLLAALIVFVFLCLVSMIIWMVKAQLDETIVSQGQLLPRDDYIDLQTQISGYVEDILVINNSTVEKGDIILRLNSRAKLLDLEEERIYRSVLYTNLATVQDEYNTMKTLLDGSLISMSRFQEVNRTKIALEGDIALSSNRIKRLNSEIEYLTLRSPITGTIHNLKNIHQGSFVSIGGLICQILPANSDYKAEIAIKPSDIGKVRVNQPVKVYIQSFDNENFGVITTTLTDISRTTYLSKDNKSYYQGTVGIPLSSLTDGINEVPLKFGMPVEAHIIVNRRSVLDYLISPIKHSLQKSFNES
ncbi:HlyD family secretion protein [Spirochaeta cellobiosiphila]|uniref:HlyD family secretion protein n=1 Tax=Spirochaeta cellobiosiphila TaxID=504483 RepID=UPI0004197B91|nr:HlyD family efflux transporter periplasmic adaptor subunit [Spirochaeta cellobiosiphila]